MNQGAPEKSSSGEDDPCGKRAQQVSLFKATEMTLQGRGAGQTLVAAGWRAGSRKEPYACRTEAPCFQHQWKSAM